MVRAFASEAAWGGGGGGGTSTGFSSLKKITSMMGAPCNTLFMRCLEYLADSGIARRFQSPLV